MKTSYWINEIMLFNFRVGRLLWIQQAKNLPAGYSSFDLKHSLYLLHLSVMRQNIKSADYLQQMNSIFAQKPKTKTFNEKLFFSLLIDYLENYGCWLCLHDISILRFIQNFKVTHWPAEDHGKFYNGDSYIILNVRSNVSRLIITLLCIVYLCELGKSDLC